MPNLIDLAKKENTIYCWDKDKDKIVAVEIKEISSRSLPEDIIEQVFKNLAELKEKR
jgi:hypothetical protein